MNNHRKNMFHRAMIYVIGLLVLGIGITLNIKTMMGVSPITSVAYSISEIYGLNFGNMTFIVYCSFIIVQLMLSKKDHYFKIILQIPLSYVFTRWLNVLGSWIPDFDSIGIRVVMLVFAVLFTGIGAMLSIRMDLVPNPADGIVGVISHITHRRLGAVKNMFDLTNVSITLILSFFLAGRIIGVGIGTVAAVLGVGRVIALMDRFIGQKIAVYTETSRD